MWADGTALVPGRSVCYLSVSEFRVAERECAVSETARAPRRVYKSSRRGGGRDAPRRVSRRRRSRSAVIDTPTRPYGLRRARRERVTVRAQ